MPRPDFNDLTWFETVAMERSFTRAAAKIGVAQSTLSHAIRRLERNMGLRLLSRTTRSVAPTEAGARLLKVITPSLGEIENEIAALTAFRDTPSGSLRVTLSDHALETVVWPKLKPVLTKYPDIGIEFSIDNGLRNIVEDGFDAGVRLGESIERDMIAVRIGPDWRMVAVAAPDYLADREVPDHPHDLLVHNCMNLRQQTRGGLYDWEFEKDGHEVRVRVTGQLTFNTNYAMIDAALSGMGIAFVPNSMADPHVATGDLVLLLDDWSPLFDGYFLYYPTRRQALPAFKLVLEALRLR